VIETEGDGANATTVEQPRSVLDGLNLDTAIRLRWALRDIKAKRTKFSPVGQDDLMALIELGLIEMQNDEPASPMRECGPSRTRPDLPDLMRAKGANKRSKPENLCEHATQAARHFDGRPWLHCRWREAAGAVGGLIIITPMTHGGHILHKIRWSDCEV
jgi:hypothetical protein